MTSDQRARELREALTTADRSGTGRPYPRGLRRAVTAYWREREQDGASMREVAKELGVSEMSLSRWSRRKEEPTMAFRAIEVVTEPARHTSAMVVRGPRGLCIEGLTVAELAELIARLS